MTSQKSMLTNDVICNWRNVRCHSRMISSSRGNNLPVATTSYPKQLQCVELWTHQPSP